VDRITRVGAALRILIETLAAAGAIFGLLHQELTGRVEPELLPVYLVLLGIPTGTSAWRLFRPGTAPTPVTTTGGRSGSDSPPSSVESSQSSSS
jgi:hypothetical protein